MQLQCNCGHVLNIACTSSPTSSANPKTIPRRLFSAKQQLDILGNLLGCNSYRRYSLSSLTGDCMLESTWYHHQRAILQVIERLGEKYFHKSTPHSLYKRKKKKAEVHKQLMELYKEVPRESSEASTAATTEAKEGTWGCSLFPHAP